MQLTLFVHLFVLGLWLGCVMVELVLELMGRTAPALGDSAARVHKVIDRFIEIPAFTIVLVTGIMMIKWDMTEFTYWLKIGLGLFTIAINAACVVPVLRRVTALDRGDRAASERQTRRIFVYFGIGLVTGLGALAIGVIRMGIVL